MEVKVISEGGTHERFHRTVWASRDDFTGALAKWLVKLSPYTVPENLSICVEKFNDHLDSFASFDSNGTAEIDLKSLTHTVNPILESIPEIMALNERKNGRDGMGFSDRYSGRPEADDDFIDIMALAQNITCEFAARADAECWLDRDK